eukprot:6274814-Prorocentrum_lima.AAC.1
MTSSLVGSEMCIRDRCNGASLGCLCQPPRGRIPGRLGLLTPLQPHAASSVSYTHLTLPTICSV